MGFTLFLLATGVTAYKIHKAIKKYKRKASDTFSISGPKLPISIDWNNSYYRTVVTSCLVKAVYTLQTDKTDKRKPLAKPWWEFFGFSLVETLINEADSSIYGAVFKYNKYDSYQNTPHLGIPPRYVIAFRGTDFSSETWYSDVKQDLRCLFNNLNEGRRFEHAVQAIQNVLDNTSEKTSVWLAGHSLGAGIALLAGKTMTRMGFPLKTYAFNPPNTSIEQLFPCDEGKVLFLVTKIFIMVTVASLFEFEIKEDDQRVAEWIPYLYVNPNDKICSGYIDEFKHKNITLVDQISLRSLFFGAGSAEPIHLLPSFNMTVNKNKETLLENKETEKEEAHQLKQWWESDPAHWETNKFRLSI